MLSWLTTVPGSMPRISPSNRSGFSSGSLTRIDDEALPRDILNNKAEIII